MAEKKDAARLRDTERTRFEMCGGCDSGNHFEAHLYNSTSEKKMQEDFIFSLLPAGKDNAISTKDLLRLSGFSSVRAMTKEIEAERRNGALILSRCDEQGGYYRPADGAQGVASVREYARQMERRAKSIFYTIKAARKYIKENEVAKNG